MYRNVYFILAAAMAICFCAGSNEVIAASFMSFEAEDGYVIGPLGADMGAGETGWSLPWHGTPGGDIAAAGAPGGGDQHWEKLGMPREGAKRYTATPYLDDLVTVSMKVRLVSDSTPFVTGGNDARFWIEDGDNGDQVDFGIFNSDTFVRVRHSGEANINLVATGQPTLPVNTWFDLVFQIDQINRKQSVLYSQAVGEPLHLLQDAAGNTTWDYDDAGPGAQVTRVGFNSPDGIGANEGLQIDDVSIMFEYPVALNPDPCDGETRVQPDTILSWDPPDPCNLVDPPAEYIVYFDPNESLVTSGDASICLGQLSETQIDPYVGDLKLGTTYYWRVDVVDPNFGEPVTYAGKVWHFTTITPKAGLVFPTPSGITGVAQNAVLQWNSGIGAIKHDVYIDPCEAWVVSGDVRAYKGPKEETSFDPDLDWETEYFWRIDEVFASGGDPEPGDVWSFTTGTPICEYELEGDIDKNCVVNLEDFALMADSWLICNLANGDCP